jgi:acetolactate synthase small subunit
MKRFLLLLPALVLAACAAQVGPTAPGSAPAGIGSAELKAEQVARDGGVQPLPLPAAADPERALIRTGTVSMKARDAWSAADRVQGIAGSLGGEVSALSQSGAGNERSANLTIRVPAARFDEALRQLRGLADVEIVSSAVESRDVTEQFVDLEARLRAKQAEEQRYLALLARAERIEDILRIDQALASVRTEIERLTGQLNAIRSRVDFSTISVAIAPLVAGGPAEPYDPARTAERALAALLIFLRFAADAAIWVLVFGWIPLAALGLSFGISRLRARPSATS